MNDHLVPPHDLDAERSVIGAMLVSEPAVSVVADKLQRDDFYSETHRLIFDAAMKLYAKSEAIDRLTLKNELQKVDEYERTGGEAYLFRLAESVPTAANVKRYAEMVRGQSLLRHLIDVCEITKQECLSPFSDDPTEVLDAAEQRLYGISNNSNREGGLKSIGDLMPAALEKMQRLYEAGGEITGVPSGFPDLDRKTSGFQAGDLIVLAARPSMGKTAMALDIVWNVAEKERLPVAIFSLEMSEEQLNQRLISKVAGIDLSRVRSGQLKPEEWPRFVRVSARIARAPIHIDDTVGIAVPAMRSRLRRLVGRIRGKVGLVVVDYLQLVASSTKKGNREQEVSEISRSLKVLARNFEVPVLGVAQLSRECEKRHDKRPMLSDLRDCLVGETLVVDVRTGSPKQLKDVREGDRVLSVNGEMHVVEREVSGWWCAGTKSVYRLTTSAGQQIEGTADHRIRLPDGWKTLGALVPGDLVAAPTNLPEWQTGMAEDLCRFLGYMVGNGSYRRHQGVNLCMPEDETFEDAVAIVSNYFPGVSMSEKNNAKPVREGDFARVYENGHGKPYGNPLREWIRELGIFNQRAENKEVPRWVFRQGVCGAVGFLSGYLAADGCVKSAGHEACFDSASKGLLEGVRVLLLKLGAASYLVRSGSGWRLTVAREHAPRLARVLSGPSRKISKLKAATPKAKTCAGQLALPRIVSVLAAKETNWRDQGKRMRRDTCVRLAEESGSEELQRWAYSELWWPSVVSVDYVGEKETYDIEVPDAHNFIANGLVVHNSGAVEQDADIVLFLYRDEYYNPDSEAQGMAELNVAKNRNGPTGKVDLAWIGSQARFGSLQKVVGRVS